MSDPADTAKVRGSVAAELAALADGSLPHDRRAAVLARVHRSPTLRAALADQRRVVMLLRSDQVTAPASLHERVRALVDQRCRARDELSVEDRDPRRAAPASSQVCTRVRRTLKGVGPDG